MSERIDYGNLMHDAMRSLIRKVLDGVAETGLPGEHHFFITFSTQHPDVAIADWLRERYPEEMTIVLQHWFDALIVDESGFSVTLNFGDTPEVLHVPFDALRTFVDPSVEFGLRFESQTNEAAKPPAPDQDPDPEEPDDDPTPDGGGDGQVVQLDRFRKS